MTHEQPYNPLDKLNLGASVAEAILRRAPIALPPPTSFDGAGVYAIYYTGKFSQYKLVSQENRNQKFNWPIYVGKAIPKGGRKGNRKQKLDLTPASVGPVLCNRLKEHADSIRQASNLDIEDFTCRYLVVDDIWIPLGESLLIDRFNPIWNLYIDGFGNHDPGGGRYQQKRSPWDVIHPGREWALKCAKNEKTDTEIHAALADAIKVHLLQMKAESESNE